MKHLKKYQLFLEEKFDTSDTDPEDVKQAKNYMNKIDDDIKKYVPGKSAIDNAYKSVKDKEELKSDEFGEKIKKIVGEGDNFNKFLNEWDSITRLQKEVSLKEEEIVKDKVRKDEMRSYANTLDDTQKETKATATAQITEIQNRINQSNKDILDYNKKVEELKKDHLKGMEEEKKKMNDYIKKISDSEQK